MDTRSFDLPRYLGVLPLFSDLSRPELERLARGCQLRRYGRGDPVFRVGEPCNEFHVSVTGQVKLFAVSASGQQKVIELVGPGQSFAEALMFTGRPYIIDAQSLTDSLLLSVGKAAVEAGIGHDAHFAMRVLHELEAGGLTEIDKRDIHRLDPQRLAQYSGAAAPAERNRR